MLSQHHDLARLLVKEETRRGYRRSVVAEKHLGYGEKTCCKSWCDLALLLREGQSYDEGSAISRRGSVVFDSSISDCHELHLQHLTASKMISLTKDDHSRLLSSLVSWRRPGYGVLPTS